MDDIPILSYCYRNTNDYQKDEVPLIWTCVDLLRFVMEVTSWWQAGDVPFNQAFTVCCDCGRISSLQQRAVGSHFRVLRHPELLLGHVFSSLCHLSLSCTCSPLHPSALWQSCLFRPCRVGCPVLKGILFCSRAAPAAPECLFLFQISRDLFELGMWVCVRLILPCEYSVSNAAINDYQIIKVTREAEREAVLRVRYKHTNIYQYMHSQKATVLNTEPGIRMLFI